ncbi:hypothetical protein BJ165DRAFT_1404816 [Panaeolus papilionaceus]|nr:hypothetical protein BJ165DRAFT_1404816 [Panaeolus papilionaceus]
MNNDPVFPLEIFQLIVAQLASDATRPWEAVRADLNSCCLVAKSFVQIAREFIFQDITTDSVPDENKRAQDLAWFLQSNPRLVDHVQKLTFKFRDQSHFRRETELTSATTVFPHCPNVQHLVVEASNRLPYSKLQSPGFDNLLDHYISTGCITEVSLSWIGDIPLLVLLQYPSLKFLSLHDCALSIPPIPFAKNPLPHGSSLIRFLSTETEGGSICYVLRYCQNIEEILMLDGQSDYQQPESQHPPPFAFPRLRKITSHSMYEWETLLKSSALPVFPAITDLRLSGIWDTDSIRSTARHIPALENLTIEGANHRSTQYLGGLWIAVRELTFSTRHSLKTFSVKWSLDMDSIINFFPLLCSALGPLKNNSVLNELTLDLQIGYEGFTLIPTAFEQWGQVDGLIWGDEDDFPALKRLNLFIRYEFGRLPPVLSPTGGDPQLEDWRMLNEPLRKWRVRKDVRFESKISTVVYDTETLEWLH